MPPQNIRDIVRSSGVFGVLDTANSHADHDKYVCRWHSDTDASLAVYADHAYCYGCGHRVAGEEIVMLVAQEKGMAAAIPPTDVQGSLQPPPPASVYSSPPKRHWRLGSPSVVYAYQDSAGEDCAMVYRFDYADGTKEVRQLKKVTAQDGTQGWSWGGHKANRPLYNIGAVTAASEVIVAEGEKSAEAINMALKLSGITGITATTPIGGSKAPRKTDWRPLVGKRVYIWPDNDKPGMDFATDVAALCNGVGSVSVQQFESQFVMGAEGADAADVSPERVVQILGTRQQWQHRYEKHNIPDGSGSVPPDRRRDTIVEALSVFIQEFKGSVFTFRDKKYICFAAGKLSGETLPINSDSDNPLTWAVYEVLFSIGAPATARNVQNIVSALKATPSDSEEHVGWRFALCGRAMYINCDKGIQIKISESKWMEYIPATESPVSFPPLQYGRTKFEVANADNNLRHYMDKHFFSVPASSRPLIAAWICLAPFGAAAQQPILNLMGESGSGKTSVAIAIRNIVDPHSDEAYPTQLPASTKEAAFLMSMSDVHIFDNVSKIPQYMSDFLCTMVTGGSFVQRKLFTDDTPHRYRMSVAAIITSLDSITDRADLVDRLVTIPMCSSPEYVNATRAVNSLKSDLPAIRLLMMHVATQVMWARSKPTVQDKLTNMRMVEWLNRALLAATLAGYSEQEFISAITESSDSIVDDIIIDDIVLDRLQYVLTKEGAVFPMTMPMSQLFDEMKMGSSADVKRFENFPSSVPGLGKAVSLRKPLLRKLGFYLHQTRMLVGGVRTRVIKFYKV